MYPKLEKFEMKVCFWYGKWEVREHYKNAIKVLCVTGMRRCGCLNQFQLLCETYPLKNLFTFLAIPTHQKSRYWVISMDHLRKDSDWVRKVIFQFLQFFFVIVCQYAIFSFHPQLLNILYKVHHLGNQGGDCETKLHKIKNLLKYFQNMFLLWLRILKYVRNKTWPIWNVLVL